MKTTAYCCCCFGQSHMSAYKPVCALCTSPTYLRRTAFRTWVSVKQAPSNSVSDTNRQAPHSFVWLSWCEGEKDETLLIQQHKHLIQNEDFFLNCELLHVMYFSQIFYKIPRGCLHPSIPWKTKTNHCLFSCCWTIVVLWSVPHELLLCM